MIANSIYLVQAFALLGHCDELKIGKDEILSPLDKLVYWIYLLSIIYVPLQWIFVVVFSVTAEKWVLPSAKSISIPELLSKLLLTAVTFWYVCRPKIGSSLSQGINFFSCSWYMSGHGYQTLCLHWYLLEVNMILSQAPRNGLLTVQHIWLALWNLNFDWGLELLIFF